MTHSRIPENYRLKMGRSIVFQFCEGDQPLKDTGKFIGLADQAIYKAQVETKSTHLLDVLVMKEGDCAVLEGFAAKARKIKRRKKRTNSARNFSSVEEFDWTEVVLPPDPIEETMAPVGDEAHRLF